MLTEKEKSAATELILDQKDVENFLGTENNNNVGFTGYKA